MGKRAHHILGEKHCGTPPNIVFIVVSPDIFFKVDLPAGIDIRIIGKTGDVSGQGQPQIGSLFGLAQFIPGAVFRMAHKTFEVFDGGQFFNGIAPEEFRRNRADEGRVTGSRNLSHGGQPEDIIGCLCKLVQTNDSPKRFSSVLVVFAYINLLEESAAGDIDGIGFKIIV
ncbi:MAG: hypothetical protein A4E66_02202 [Syntrophus sp. PtaB.Bin001]|nr:MAG: hypothetical protein A4E66_02202 [Syntrophus sp. PtaB.Bin001]